MGGFQQDGKIICENVEKNENFLTNLFRKIYSFYAKQSKAKFHVISGHFRIFSRICRIFYLFFCKIPHRFRFI